MQHPLIVATDPAQQRVSLRLLDEHGVQRGAQQVHLPEYSPALWTGLFDTRCYVLLHQGNLILDGQTRPATAAQLLQHLGVFLGEQVLEAEILQALTQTAQRRTLLVQLPPQEPIHDPSSEYPRCQDPVLQAHRANPGR